MMECSHLLYIYGNCHGNQGKLKLQHAFHLGLKGDKNTNMISLDLKDKQHYGIGSMIVRYYKAEGTDLQTRSSRKNL
jgi:hypothetical protein